jgi:hypothetical protein
MQEAIVVSKNLRYSKIASYAPKIFQVHFVVTVISFPAVFQKRK